MRCPGNRAPHTVPCDNPWTGAHLTAPTSCLSPISRDVRPFSIERFLFVRFPIWVIVTVLFIVVYILVREVLRRYYNAKYEGFFATAHYQEALDTLDALPSRVTMTTYQQYSRRFFCYEAMENKEMATRMIELMVRMRHSQKRQVQVLTMAFNYYVQIGEKNRAKELLAQLKAVKNVDKAIVTDCQLTYEIVFKKRYDFIDQMEKMLKKAGPELQGKLCFLLSKQYANKGDKTHAKQYKRRYEELARANAPEPRPDAAEKAK